MNKYTVMYRPFERSRKLAIVELNLYESNNKIAGNIIERHLRGNYVRGQQPKLVAIFKEAM